MSENVNNISITSGTIRRLLPEERLLYPNFKYVTINESKYKDYDNNYEIIVPRNYLNDGSSGGPDYGRSWLFHDYLYCTHKFADGTECSREQADKIMSDILLHENLRFYNFLFTKIVKLNPFWMMSRAWKNSGERGPVILNTN